MTQLVLLKKDEWNGAIIGERSRKVQNLIPKALVYVTEIREEALVLGDACKINSKYLIESAGFKHVSVVDYNPLLIDNEILSNEDPRFSSYLMTFDECDFEAHKFDYIHGKSIGFNPRETVSDLLNKIAHWLKPDGIFSAEWALIDDAFRPVIYTYNELIDLYRQVGFEIIDCSEHGPHYIDRASRPGVCHTQLIIAKLKS